MTSSMVLAPTLYHHTDMGLFNRTVRRQSDGRLRKPVEITPIAEEKPVREVPHQKSVVENDGWGPVFRGRDNFLEMHIC